jgi:hypothetical protein
MAAHYHAVIWIDHHQAKVFHFNPDDAELAVIRPDHPVRHIHHKANTIGNGHAAEDQDFLHSVASAVGAAGAILITGPANAKTELMKHMQKHAPAIAKLVAGVETVDHPSDGALVDHARRYFNAADRMIPRLS